MTTLRKMAEEYLEKGAGAKFNINKTSYKYALGVYLAGAEAMREMILDTFPMAVGDALAISTFRDFYQKVKKLGKEEPNL